MSKLGSTPLSLRSKEQPLSVLAHLNLYEGLACTCDELTASAPGTREHEMAQVFRTTYQDIFGIEPRERADLRASLEKLIDDQPESRPPPVGETE